MSNMVSLCILLLVIYIAPTLSENTEKETSKEWIFQFDLKNDKNWADYSVVRDDKTSSDELVGSSNGCTQRIPVIFKKLCVNWNDNNGFSLKFKSSNNINIDPKYDDLLWYYGDDNTAKNAEKAAKAKYLDLEDKELTEIGHNRRRLVRKFGTKKCYWYSDAKACTHIDASNKHLMTVSVGVNEDDYDDAAAEYSDFADYYYDDEDEDEEYYDDDEEYEYDDEYEYGDEDEEYNYDYDDYDDYDYDYDDDYAYDGEYDLDDIYQEYMQQMQQQQAFYNQQQQELYNQQWANYLQNLNNFYWQQQAAAAANGYLYGDYYDDSDEKAAISDNEGEGEGEGAQFGISEGDIMQKAEADARKHVEARMEKKLEGRLEKQMMSKLNAGFGGEVTEIHKKGHHYGEDMDEEHMGEPQEEGEIEQDQNERAPHDSLSQESH